MYYDALKMMAYLMRPHHIIYYLSLAYKHDVHANPQGTQEVVGCGARDLLPGESVGDCLNRKQAENHAHMRSVVTYAASFVSLFFGLASFLLSLVGLALTLLSLG